MMQRWLVMPGSNPRPAVWATVVDGEFRWLEREDGEVMVRSVGYVEQITDTSIIARHPEGEWLLALRV